MSNKEVKNLEYNEELLTVREVADILDITPQGVYSLIRRDKLKPIKSDTTVFIQKSEVSNFVNSHKKVTYTNGKIRYFKLP